MLKYFLFLVKHNYLLVREAEYRQAARYLCQFPPDSYAFARGRLALALADVYRAMAEVL